MSLKLEQNLELWLNSDQLIVSGIWKTIPNHKQLRIAYEETIWFKKTKSELRNLKINSLF
jgi:hypothetical protein